MTTTTKDEVTQSVARFVEQLGMSMEEFVEAGRADQLTDADLRDLWLMYKGVLTNRQ